MRSSLQPLRRFGPCLWAILGRVLGYSRVRSPGGWSDRGEAQARGKITCAFPFPHCTQLARVHKWVGNVRGMLHVLAPESFCLAALPLTLHLSCFPLILAPFRAAEAANRRNEHHLMQRKKANEKAQGNLITSPMTSSECVALSEIVQPSQSHRII